MIYNQITVEKFNFSSRFIMLLMLRKLLILAFLGAVTACTINTEKVVLNSNQVVSSTSMRSLSSAEIGTHTAVQTIKTSYILNVAELNTQQKIEIYQWLKHREGTLVLGVVKDNDFLRVRLKRQVSQDNFVSMVREAGKLDDVSYEVIFDGNYIKVKKIY